MPKISALSAASALDGSEQVPVVQSSSTKRTTTGDIAKLLGGVGTYANRPAAGRAGRIYTPTDGYCSFIDDGATWRPMFGGKIGNSPPVAADWTQVNMSNGSIADEKGTILLSAPSAASGATNRIVCVRTAPATPFTLSAGIEFNGWPAVTTGIGIVYRDSGTGRLILSQLVWTGSLSVQLQNWTNATTFSSNIQNMGSWPEDITGGRFYLHLRDPGSGNLTWSYSKNGDYANSVTIDNATGRTAWLANPNQVGIVIINENTEPRAKVGMRLIDWTLTS